MKNLRNLKKVSLKRLREMNFILSLFLSFNIFSKDGRDIYKYALEKVVRIEVPNGHGTGFILTNGLLITNNHVVENFKNNEIKINFSDGKTLTDVVVLYKNEAEDIALLSVDIDKPGFEIATSYEIGEKIFVLGNPDDFEFSLTDGILSKITKDRLNVENLQFTAPALKGSSGSPILNNEGKLVGILKSGLGISQGFNFGTSVFNITKALKHTILLNENINKLDEECKKDGKSCYFLGLLLMKSSLSEKALEYFNSGCYKNSQSACVYKAIINHSRNLLSLSNLRFELKNICTNYKDVEACKLSTIFEEDLVVKDNLIPLIDIEIKLPDEFELVKPAYSKISGDEFLISISDMNSTKFLGWIENRKLISNKEGRTYLQIEEFEIRNEDKEAMKGVKLKQLAEAAIGLIKEDDKNQDIEQVSISKIKNKEPYLYSIDILEKSGLKKKEIHIYGDRNTALRVLLLAPRKAQDTLEIAEKILIESISQKSSGGVIFFDKGRYLRRLAYATPLIMVFILAVYLFIKKRKEGVAI